MHLHRRSMAVLAVSISVLKEAMAQGWVATSPVYRKRIPDRPDGAWYCDIILWREGRVKILTVPEDEELRRFLAEHALDVTPQ